jgi:hypothetical protein
MKSGAKRHSAVAERVGFEPTSTFRALPLFESGAFGHSATSPFPSLAWFGFGSSCLSTDSQKVVTPVKTVVQGNRNSLISLDSGFRRNDENVHI